MTASTPRRTDEERLALVLRLADTIAASPALGSSTVVAIHGGGAPLLTIKVDEPDLPLVRSLLTDLRKFDQPREDVYLPDLYGILDARPLDPVTRSELAKARAAYEATQAASDVMFEDPDKVGQPDPYLSPRHAFELWVYGQHLHNDVRWERKYDSLGGMGQWVVQSMARDYAAMLVEQVAFLAKVIRDL